MKDLGVYFDPQLTFNAHIKNTISSAYRTLGFLSRNSRAFKNIDTLKLLFSTFIRTKLEYACLIWNPGYNLYITGLENVQRRFFKSASYILDNVYPLRHTPQEQFYRRFGACSLAQRRKMHSVIFLFKVINNYYTSSHILEMINFRIPRLSSRDRSVFYSVPHRTNVYTFSPLQQLILSYSLVEDKVDLFCTNNKKIKACFI